MGPRIEPVIGIVGGMGPQAGLALFNNILKHTDAATDQEHLSTIMMSFPKQIVDRTSFLEGETAINPAFGIVNIIQKLERAGADLIGICCNTSHSPEIFDTISSELNRKQIRVTVLNMLVETVACIKEKYPHAQRIGFMVTNGTYKSALYHELLRKSGYEITIPEFEFQCNVIHKMIYNEEYGLKANAGRITRPVRELAKKAMQYFNKQGSDVVILGCTDLSILLDENILNDIRVVDSTDSLARALVREAREKYSLKSGKTSLL
jgi:aspartate racemase